MRQLLPDADDVDALHQYLAARRPAPEDRPWVTVGMIASLDGATAIAGRSGALGGPADQEVLRAVRAVADVILVAAGTVRAEGYGPVRLSRPVRDARVAAGRSAEPPRLAIVSASLALDPDHDVFRDEGAGRPIVFTTRDADPARRAALEPVAEVRAAGAERVEVAQVLRSLRDDGAEVVVCEGGPTLNGALVDAGVVDEWCVSLTPLVAGGPSHRLVRGAAPAGPQALELASLLEADGLLFGRWVRRGPD